VAFSKDDIWGVRKVCVEKASELVGLLKEGEVEKIKEVLGFIRSCFNDSSRWVKNTAFS